MRRLRAPTSGRTPARVAPGGAAPRCAEPSPVTRALPACRTWGCPATGPAPADAVEQIRASRRPVPQLQVAAVARPRNQHYLHEVVIV